MNIKPFGLAIAVIVVAFVGFAIIRQYTFKESSISIQNITDKETSDRWLSETRQLIADFAPTCLEFKSSRIIVYDGDSTFYTNWKDSTGCSIGTNGKEIFLLDLGEQGPADYTATRFKTDTSDLIRLNIISRFIPLDRYSIEMIRDAGNIHSYCFKEPQKGNIITYMLSGFPRDPYINFEFNSNRLVKIWHGF